MTSHDLQNPATPMPPNRISGTIDGLYETHLPVADLPRSRAFYQDILGLTLAHELPQRRVEFYWVGSPDSAMLGLWETGSAPLGMQLHFAFRMAAADIHRLCDQLSQRGIQPLGLIGEKITEPTVIGWMPALSVYCKDPDGHSIEFIAKLPEPPDLGFSHGPYSRWQQRDNSSRP
ncbi:VOC family protein [Pseudophaeobacter sp.]|uniref:VOC family protein n=1 Tax=Pseudophaeobacter sp. TaxID=1971739 RepID=UPI0032997298